MTKQKIKVTKKQFLTMVSKDEEVARLLDEIASLGVVDSDVKLEAVNAIYEAITDRIVDSVKEGKRVSLAGFGSFQLQKHKGHPVRFKSGESAMPDYMVLKFTVSDIVSKDVRYVGLDGSVEISEIEVEV